MINKTVTLPWKPKKSIKRKTPTVINLNKSGLQLNILIDLDSRSRNLYSEYSHQMDNIKSLFYETRLLFPLTNGYLFNSDYAVIKGCAKGKKIPFNYIKAEKIRQVLSESKGWKDDMVIKTDKDRKIYEYWNEETIRVNAKAFFNLLEIRKQLINSGVNKLNVVLDIVLKLKKPAIILVQDYHFCKLIIDLLNYKSKSSDLFTNFHESNSDIAIEYKNDINSKRTNNKAIELFLSNNVKYLCIVDKLKNKLLDFYNLRDCKYIINTSGFINPYDILTINDDTVIFNLIYDDFQTRNDMISSKEKTTVKESVNIMAEEVIELSSFDLDYNIMFENT